MNLKECIKRDIDSVFLRTEDFCHAMTMQVGNSRFVIVGSLQANTVQNNSGNGQPLQDDAWTLYTSYPMGGLLSAGARITIDDRPFSVVSVSDEMGLATIQLTTRVGR